MEISNAARCICLSGRQPVLLLVAALQILCSITATFAQRADLVVQTGHTSSVGSVAISPNGRVIASIGLQSTITLWDAKSGLQLRSLVGHEDAVDAIAFSPDGRMLASGGAGFDPTIRLWDVAAGSQIGILKGHTQAILSLAFSPNGKVLASGGYDETLRIWDLEGGKLLSTLLDHKARVETVAFSPDGQIVASGSFDGTVILRKAGTGERLRTLSGHSEWVSSIAFSPDGQTIFSGSWDKTVKHWRIADGVELRAFGPTSEAVVSIAISPDGKTLACATTAASQNVILWDVATRTRLKTLSGHVDAVQAVRFFPDGRELLTGGDDKTIKRWDIRSGSVIKDYTGNGVSASHVLFAPDGKSFVSYGAGRTLRIWRIGDVLDTTDMIGPAETVLAAAFSYDGRFLATADIDGALAIWDIKKRALLKTITVDGGWYFSIAFSPNGEVIAAGGVSKTIETWNVKTGEKIKSFLGHTEAVRSILFSPNGKNLASGAEDATVRLWDVSTGNALRTYLGHTDSVRCLSFSPDGQRLASAGIDRTVKVWDVDSGGLLNNLVGHVDVVFSIEFSQHENTLVSGSKDKTIKIWNLENSKPIQTLRDRDDIVWSVTSPSDRKLFLSGGDNGKIKIWHLDRPNPVATLVSLGEKNWVVALPDGRFDTSKELDQIDGLHWIVSDDPLQPVPLEIFMRDYYEPRLLQRTLACTENNNCDHEFKPLPNIADLNRVQPMVRITNVSMPDINRRVKVTVEAGKGAVPQEDCRMKRCDTGVYDLRLFRDGQIVGTYPGDAQAELIRQSESLQTSIAEKDLWRNVSEIKADKTAGCKTGAAACARQTFEVALPKGRNVADIEFTAYAFNEDRVKSQTAKWEWPGELVARLPKSQPVKPRAYVISVGVNAYENHDFDLEFADDDARRMSAVIAERLTITGQYGTVIPVTLISDYETSEGRRIVTEKQATKDKFHAVLELLAGKNVDRQLLAGVKNGDELQRATPDDLVLIMYSSHGYADRAGNFYFIPYDTGPGTGKFFTESVRKHSISSDELSLWLRDVDAGEMVMIVDACHSAAAIEGSDFKPGPMGSRGLGQLSYDKGMKILTATQADNVALENNLIKQGLLTYALVRDGIEARQADYKPKDNVINIGEWLSYGVDRVPGLYEEVRAGKIRDFGSKSGTQTKVVVVGQSGKSSGKTLEEVVTEAKAQRPSLFDFTRRRREVALVK